MTSFSSAAKLALAAATLSQEVDALAVSKTQKASMTTKTNTKASSKKGLIATALGESSNSYIATSLKFETTLRVCNAYPFSDAAQVYDQSISYKGCAEMQRTLQQGDQIDFFADGKKVLLGSFEVQDTPREDSTLLLVLQPLDADSTGVSFQSHAYANSQEAQVALLDAYVPAQGGKAAAGAASSDLIDIKDAYGAQPRDEKLRLNSVVGLNAGYYTVGTTETEKKSLHALEGEKISIIRVGIAGSKTNSEDLIVFPDSNQSLFSGLFFWATSWI